MSYARCAVGISGSGREQRLVRSAIELVEQFGARCQFVHVVDLFAGISSEALTGLPEAPPLAGPASFDSVADSEQLRKYVEQQAGTCLDGERWVFKVAKGNSRDELVAYARKLDLLILGHHHVHPILHVVSHGLDEKVLNRVLCKLLIVPE